jgi:plastocyanin
MGAALKTKLPKWILFVPIVFLLASVPAGSASAVAPATVRIPIGPMAFSAAPGPVRVGDVVEWVNNDVLDHTATEKKAGWDVTMAPGKRARVVMKKAGTFDYYCRYHPNMVGRLVVSAPVKKK